MGKRRRQRYLMVQVKSSVGPLRFLHFWLILDCWTACFLYLWHALPCRCSPKGFVSAREHCYELGSTSLAQLTSKENRREVILCDPACHDSPTSYPALNAEPGLSTRFFSKAHWRKINAKGGQTEQHSHRVGEVREKGSCNLSALACQCGQDDHAPQKDNYLDMHKCHLFFHMKDKISPLPTSYQVSMKVWEGKPISAGHPRSTTKENAGMEGGYTRCVAGSWES